MAKNLVLGSTLAPKFGAHFFSLKNLACSVTRYHGQLSSCAISEKTNDPILRKLSDGQTDGLRDKQMEQQRDQSNDEHSIIVSICRKLLC